MVDLARAREAIEKTIAAKTLHEARYYAQLARGYLVGEIVMDQITPDSPFEAVPGQDFGPGPRSITITCPRCGRTSYHPEDVAKRYCGACHMFHEDMDPFDQGGRGHSLKGD